MRHLLVTVLFAAAVLGALHDDDARFHLPATAATQAPGTTTPAGRALIAWVFFLPGDLLIGLPAHALPEAAGIDTGIDTGAYGGRVAGLLSVLGWILILQAAWWWLALPFRLVLRDPRRRPD